MVYDPITDNFKDRFDITHLLDEPVPEIVKSDLALQSHDQPDISVLSGQKFCLKDHPTVVYDQHQRAWIDRAADKIIYGLNEPSELRNARLNIDSPETSHF